ncbi:MAG: class I SAM-dependent methyltransferase [Deltaproteobacteria bacterium]|nr:class I SAM-dependent methyltransferase [Deltaproteobacteria bacterium]MBW2008484.1 class I SAM-dependent methyltransferase [Deltaproteobacteria bacterium]
MAPFVCPPWIGYLLINPFRKFLENPKNMLGPLVREGMVILEPGCGMGYFTLPLARMTGPGGRVVVSDLEPRMLAALEKRARKARLLDRIEIRRARGDDLGLEGLEQTVDLAVAIHVVHEVPDQRAFFGQIYAALKPGGECLVREPSFHVSRKRFEESMARAEGAGFKRRLLARGAGGLGALLLKEP